jgi:hypothetical protein
MIDEVRIYDRALNDREVEVNSKAEGLAVSPAGSKLGVAWGAIKAANVF